MLESINTFLGITKKTEASIALKNPETNIPMSALEQDLKTHEAFLEEGRSEVEEKATIPDFPLDVFPEVLQNIIKEANRTLNFPIDYLAVSILYAISVAIGNTHKLKIKTGWIENALLFIILIGKKGINKSADITNDNYYLLGLLNAIKDFNAIPDKDRHSAP